MQILEQKIKSEIKTLKEDKEFCRVVTQDEIEGQIEGLEFVLNVLIPQFIKEKDLSEEKELAEFLEAIQKLCYEGIKNKDNSEDYFRKIFFLIEGKFFINVIPDIPKIPDRITITKIKE